MSHQHEHGGHQHGHEKPKSAGLHKDWRAWAVVVLMLVGIVAYVLTLDEAEQPGKAGEGQRVPAAGP